MMLDMLLFQNFLLVQTCSNQFNVDFDFPLFQIMIMILDKKNQDLTGLK